MAVRYVRDGEPRVASRPSRPRDRRRRLVACDASRCGTRDAVPLAPRRRRLRLRVAERRRASSPSTSPTPTTSSRHPAPAGPTGTSSRSSTRCSPTGSRRRVSTSTPPDWAIPRGWDELPTGRGPETPVEWFGGDLRGLERAPRPHLCARRERPLPDPVFPARSTHRYDATTFDAVDPLLGRRRGARLPRARGSRSRHPRARRPDDESRRRRARVVRRRARADTEPEREFFYFDDSLAHGYECWYGVPSLPEARLPIARSCASRMYEGDSSVVRRWLEPPFALDGWRIDVANMTGRLGGRRRPRPRSSRGVRAAAVAAAARRPRRRRARARRAGRPPRAAAGTAP